MYKKMNKIDKCKKHFKKNVTFHRILPTNVGNNFNFMYQFTPYLALVLYIVVETSMADKMGLHADLCS